MTRITDMAGDLHGDSSASHHLTGGGGILWLPHYRPHRLLQNVYCCLQGTDACEEVKACWGPRACDDTIMTSKPASQQRQQLRQQHDPQLVNLDYLTVAERQLVIAVIDRDAAIRQKEQTRIKLVGLFAALFALFRLTAVASSVFNQSIRSNLLIYGSKY